MWLAEQTFYRVSTIHKALAPNASSSMRVVMSRIEKAISSEEERQSNEVIKKAAKMITEA